jgi:hypothetical protein
MLHDSGPMKSVYGSGKITITTQSGSVTFDSASFRPEPVDLPKLPEGMTRWGKPDSADFTTKVDHVRALGGMSPDRDTLLKTVSILLPVNEVVRSDSRSTRAVSSMADRTPARPPGCCSTLGKRPKGRPGGTRSNIPEGFASQPTRRFGSPGKARAGRWKLPSSKIGSGRVISNRIAGDGTAKPSNSIPRNPGRKSGRRTMVADSIRLSIPVS